MEKVIEFTGRKKVFGIPNNEIKNLLGEELYELFSYGTTQQVLRSNLSQVTGEIPVKNCGFKYTTSFYDVVYDGISDHLIIVSIGEYDSLPPHLYLSQKREVQIIVKHIINKMLSFIMRGGRLRNNFGEVGQLLQCEAMYRFTRLQLLAEQL